MGKYSGGKGGKSTLMGEINVTPMVDVMLVLLIIFRVTAPMIHEDPDKREVELDLPVTRDNENRVSPKDIDKIILEITRNLEVKIGTEMLVDCSEHKNGGAADRFEPCFETIETKLRNNPKLQEDGQIYLLADTEIPYGFVVGTMARIRKAGVNKLGMITNPEYAAGAPAENVPANKATGGKGKSGKKK